MTPPQNIFSHLAPLLAAVFLCFPHPVFALPPEKVYAWVAQQMEVPLEQTLPEVRYVAKGGLAAAFRDSSRSSYLRWKAKYGAVRAEEIMKAYTAAVIGLFDTNTGVIFVGDFLENCRKQAILAHEFAHFFQLTTLGPVDRSRPDFDLLQLIREMDAKRIEQGFDNRYCRIPVP